MRRFLIVISLGLVLSGAWLTLGQDEVETTPEPELSTLFSYDTCNPPCWMGLVAGESTVEVLRRVFETNTDLIPPENVSITANRRGSIEYDAEMLPDDLERGVLNFDIGTPLQEAYVTSSIQIQDGYVDVIFVLANEIIRLKRILDVLGEPDIISLTRWNDGVTSISLIYLENRIRVSARQASEDCVVSSLIDNMNLWSVMYLSPSAASRPYQLTSDIPLQPLLTSRSQTARDIPNDVWQSWLSGEVNDSCEDAWNRLEAPDITPMPELTPEN